MTKLQKISCPVCNKPNTWQNDNPFRPFCSERCKTTDLAAWASEEHRVNGEPIDPEQSDLEQE